MKDIIVGYDGSDQAHRALERAAEQAKDKLAVTVVSAISNARNADEVQRRTEDLGEALDFLKTRGVEADGVEEAGDPAQMIIDTAKERESELIIIGQSDKNLLERLIFGSVSEGVLHRADCDVLMVR